MAGVNRDWPIKMYTKVDLKMVYLMEKAFIFGQMELGIKVNLHRDLETARDC